MTVDKRCLRCPDPDPHNTCRVPDQCLWLALCVPPEARDETTVRDFLHIARALPRR